MKLESIRSARANAALGNWEWGETIEKIDQTGALRESPNPRQFKA